MKNLRNKILAIVTVVLTVALLSGGMVFISTTQKPVSVSADSVTGVVGYTLFSGTGATSTATGGTPVNLRFFGTMDCYSTFVSGPTLNFNVGGPTMTNKLQHSYDGTGSWVDLYTFPAQIVTGSVSFTRSVVLGGYIRITQTVANTNPLTSSVQCLAKNLQEGR